MEFHAGTSELVQMLRKGHHNVELSFDEWNRLITWIDMNVPDHGAWAEQSWQERSKATATTRRIGVCLARLPRHNASIDVDDVSVAAIPEQSSFEIQNGIVTLLYSSKEEQLSQQCCCSGGIP